MGVNGSRALGVELVLSLNRKSKSTLVFVPKKAL